MALFLLGYMRMLQAFLCHHQIYFLLLVLNLISHFFLRPSSLPVTSSPNLQHVSSSIKIGLFLMTLFSVILLNQSTQYILVFNVLTYIILFFSVYLKFCSNMSSSLIYYIKQHSHFLKLLFDRFITCNVFNITCYIDMDNFTDTSKAVILVTIYIVLCLWDKTFVYRVQKYLDLAFVLANLLKIWQPYCGFSFSLLTWLIFQAQY